MGKRSKKDWSLLLLVTLPKLLTGTHIGGGTLLSWCCRGYKATTHISCPSYIPSFSSDPLVQRGCHQSWNLSLSSSGICAPLPPSSLYPLWSFMFLQQLHLQSLQSQHISLVRFHHSSDVPTFISRIWSSCQGWSQFHTCTVPDMSTGWIKGRNRPFFTFWGTPSWDGCGLSSLMLSWARILLHPCSSALAEPLTTACSGWAAGCPASSEHRQC